MPRIETLEALRQLYKLPTERARLKQMDTLDRQCRRFIELSPFLLLSSMGADGTADVSPRGDMPGFVKVMNNKTLAIPDRPGNNRLDSLSNILGNPSIGLIFLIPGFQETLRINGTATVHDDTTLREICTVDGKPPATVVMVAIKEAYLHCAKSITRARLWQEDAKVDRSLLSCTKLMISESGEPNRRLPFGAEREIVERT